MPEHTDLRLAYARTFAGVSGALVLADLARQGFLSETSFSVDPQRAAFNEGRRSLALHIRRMIDGAQPQRAGGAGQGEEENGQKKRGA